MFELIIDGVDAHHLRRRSGLDGGAHEVDA